MGLSWPFGSNGTTNNSNQVQHNKLKHCRSRTLLAVASIAICDVLLIGRLRSSQLSDDVGLRVDIKMS
jgi:hypothetical protein